MRVQVCIVVEPDGDGFHAYAPALPGLHSSGQTEEEAVENAVDLAAVYLASMVKHGDPLPIACATAESERRRGHQRTQSVVLALP